MSIGEILNKKGISVTDFEDVSVDEESIERKLQIEFLEKLLKMQERKASEKEFYRFAKQNGFLSKNHMFMYLTALDEADSASEEAEILSDFGTSKELEKIVGKAAKKRRIAENIKNPAGYRVFMRLLGKQEYSPYGEKIV